MENTHKTHITSYTSQLIVLLILLILTVCTIAVTSVELGPLTMTAAIFIASLKCIIVILYFMHLKNEAMIFKISVLMVFLILAAVIALTFVDYSLN